MKDHRVDRNKLYVKRRLYIPDDSELNICMLYQYYDSPEQGHPGHKIMFQNMQNGYFWPDMAKNYKRNTVNYGTCRKMKAYNVQ